MESKFFQRSIIYAIAALGVSATAGPLDNAKALFLDGNYEQALPELQTLHRKSPRDGNTAYYLGATLHALGRDAEAAAPLKTAQGRGVADASRLLAEIDLSEYRPEEASDNLDKWQDAIRKNRKAQTPDALGQMQQRAIMMRNMMERVERIEIIDSLTVDADDFFRHYRLSPEAGRLNAGADIGMRDAMVVYSPQRGREILWDQLADSTDARVLVQAGILDDGSIEDTRRVDIDMEADAMAYPFMMPDGVTLYFAAEGPESLGGYDIFMTRRSETGEGYLQPQNIGMPYNSPANDYMLAIDEATGIGWWATDRNAPEGKVTIYEFIPSHRRVNVEPDAADLVARARISSIALTQEPDKDYDSLRRRVSELGRTDGDGSDAASRNEIALALPDGRVISRVSELKSPEARRAGERLMGIDIEIAAIQADLASLREKYGKGDSGVAHRIEGLESELAKARTRRKAAVNTVVRLECML